MRKEIWLWLALPLLICQPLYAEFKVLEETENKLILRFELKGPPVSPSPAVALLGIPPGPLPSVSIVDSESTIIPRPGGWDNLVHRGAEFEFEPIGFLRFQRMARLKVYPAQIIPAEGRVRLYKSITFNISFPTVSTSGLSSMPEDSPAFESLYRSLLINYEQAKRWRYRERSWNQLNVSSEPPSVGWVKIKLSKEGIYIITPSDLERLGVRVDGIDPRTFRLICQGHEQSIWVEGEEDGKFDSQDRIIFYGQGITRNRFTDENVYWLTWGGKLGRRAVIKDGSIRNPSAVVARAFKTLKHFEEDVIHDPLEEVTSELADHFFWTEFNGNSEREKQKFIRIRLPYALKSDRKATFRVRFQGISYKNNALHSASVFVNSVPILQAEWRRQSECIAESTFIQKYGVSNDNSVLITAHDQNNTPEGKADFYLDWIEVEYWRSFETDPKGLKFSSDIDPPVTGPVIFKVKDFFTPKVDFYQISDNGIVAKIINTEVIEERDGRFTAVMEDSISRLNMYYAVPSNGYIHPNRIVLDNPSNLRNPSNSYDYLIISHRDFLEPIQKLADFRASQGLDVLVVDVDDIYDEFSHGIFNPHAIRSFLRYAFFNWAKPPTYVLLVGDASYDYKGAVKRYYERMGIKLDIAPIFVPTYHSWAPVGGEAAMDQKFVEVSGDDRLPDMFIGRLPVQRPSEVNEIVSKIIEYETETQSDYWQSRIMEVADDDLSHAGDDEFERSRERLFRNVIPVAYEPVKIYLRKIGSPMRANKMIIDEINKGVIVAEYSGHGGSWTWADENIFRGDDIQRLSNKGKYPFLITTTCLNGFFDMPQKFGERSLAEEFLIQKDKGAIAVLSASRLTFAYANSAFDMVLFKYMFEVDPPVLGAIINQAKVEFINNSIEQWIPGAEQYILFGDPALKLKLPDLKIKAELESYSVDTSSQLVIRGNYVYDKKGDVAKWFDADIEATLIYPNNLDDDPKNDIPPSRKVVNCWGGQFGDIRFTISPKAMPGEGVIRLKAKGKGGDYAIGGARFSIQYPVILKVWHEITDNSLMVYARIQDNAGERGIKQVECKWYLTTDYQSKITRMIPEGNKEVYKTEEPIPLPEAGYSVHYEVRAMDVENRITASLEQTVPAPIGINLAISYPGEATSPKMGYEYSKEIGGWIIWAEFENKGDKPVKDPVLVCFFDGDPDKNGDGVIDTDAKILGKAVVPPESWQKAKDVMQRIRVELLLKRPLDSGVHKIYAWIDPEMPEYDHEDKVRGKIKEPTDSDNKGVKLFAVNDFILGDRDVVGESLDKILTLEIPKSSVSGETNLSVTALPISGSDQPDLFPALMPAPLGSKMFKLELRSGSASLVGPIKISMKYDRNKLEAHIRRRLNLGDYLTTIQRNQLKSEIERWEEHLAVFRWDPQLEAWRKVKSKVNTENTFYISPPISQNSFTRNPLLSKVIIDNAITPVGDWVLMFLDESRYILLLKREGADTFEKVAGIGKVGDVFRNDILGIRIILFDTKGEKPLFGDTFCFSTVMTTGNNVGIINMRNYNVGDGTPVIEPVDNPNPRRTGNWIIIFLDKRRYQIFDEHGAPVPTDGGGAVAEGKIDKTLMLRSLGIKINVVPGSQSFKAGDKFIFRTTYVGEAEAEIDRLGTFTLMHGLDDTPPDVKLWVDGETPKPGSVIPPRPHISILLEDPNFIDTTSFKLLIKADRGGKEGSFKEVSPQEYNISGEGSVVPIRYNPIFHIGRYTFRISVSDMCGNQVRSDFGDFQEMVFYVEEEPDLSPPKIRVYANKRELSDGDVLDDQPHFVLIIEDDHGLDIKTLSVQFGSEREGPKELKEEEYKLDFSPAQPDKAMLFFEPDCPNDRYILRVEVADTSENKSSRELHLEVDEPVRLEKLINVPNPISKDTVFCYYLTQRPDDVTIKIYTLTGRLVRTIEHASAERKYNEEYWDCTDEEGRPLANGVYLYKVIVRADRRKIEKIGKLAILR
ncbi:TPA: hypothetical protein EYP37_04060 [Candidatus Poribacteria bacterium]|nr:hypothetical protein [Candidatus Poribacteria bacterium]